MAYIREARYMRDGIDGLLQLGAVYRANIDMFGNSLFYPGMLIYINPFGIGGEEFLPNKSTSIANKLGLGGYHQIDKVNYVISPGSFKTKIDAMFVYSGDGDSRIHIQGKQEQNTEQPVENSVMTDPTCNDLVKEVEDEYYRIAIEQQAQNPNNIEEPQPESQSTDQGQPTSSPLSPALVNETNPDGSTDTQSINQTPLGFALVAQ